MDQKSPTVSLNQSYQIESARFLPLLAAEHPCRRMHGHSFKITLKLSGPLDSSKGWLIDFADIETAVRPILNQLDHRVLNEVQGLENPTTEMICIWLFKQIKPKLSVLKEVSVSETPNSKCSYSE